MHCRSSGRVYRAIDPAGFVVMLAPTFDPDDRDLGEEALGQLEPGIEVGTK
jgi:hypothetical protein